MKIGLTTKRVHPYACIGETFGPHGDYWVVRDGPSGRNLGSGDSEREAIESAEKYVIKEERDSKLRKETLAKLKKLGFSTRVDSYDNIIVELPSPKKRATK